MRSFLIKSVLFFVPLLAIVVVFELMIRQGKNSLNLKGAKFKSARAIDVMVLGSSHHQNAVNPKFLKGNTVNVAYGSQDYKLDYTILKNAFDSGKNPKVIVVEAAYHSLLRENPKDYWRNGLYEYFYDIDLNGNFLSKHLLISSNLKFFKQYLLQRLLKGEQSESLNEWGFDEKLYEGFFMSAGYDSSRISHDARIRLIGRVAQGADEKVVARNSEYLSKIIDLCIKKDAQIIIATPPIYLTQKRLNTVDNLHLRDDFIKKIQAKHPVVRWVNLESSSFFSVDDYINDDHLNPTGALKYTKIIDDAINFKELSN